MPKKLQIVKGTRYGRLSILVEGERRIIGSQPYRTFLCECSCGAVKDVLLKALRSGDARSCGCLHKERVSQASFLHGLSRHPLRDVWRSMVGRCYNPKHPSYADYGNRGIGVCKEWRNTNMGLQLFVDWVNDLPDNQKYQTGLEIDRKDNSKGYSPTNCHFVEHSDNMRNTRCNIWVMVPDELTDKEFESIKHLCRIKDGFYEMLFIDLWEMKGVKGLKYGTAISRITCTNPWTPLEAVSIRARKKCQS